MALMTLAFMGTANRDKSFANAPIYAEQEKFDISGETRRQPLGDSAD
jgi:hypothetical protein